MITARKQAVYVSYLVGTNLAVASLMMSLSLSYRIFAFSLLSVFILTALVVFAREVSASGNLFVKRGANLWMTFALAFICFKDFVFFLQGQVAFSLIIYSFFYLVFYLSLSVVIKHLSAEIFFKSYSIFLLFGGTFLAIADFLNLGIAILPNHIAAMFVPFSIYILYKHGVHWLSFSAFFLCFSTSILFGARGSLLVLIVFFLLLTVNKLRSSATKPIFWLVLGVTGCAQIYIALQNSLIMNELLTYRPVIWNYYLVSGLESALFGLGPVDLEASSGASEVYSNLVGRGVGEAYGVHSMYIRYFYESGIVGLFLVVIAVARFLRQRISFGWLVLGSYLIAAFFYSNQIGHPSVYSLTMTIGMVLCIPKSKFTNYLSGR